MENEETREELNNYQLFSIHHAQFFVTINSAFFCFLGKIIMVLTKALLLVLMMLFELMTGFLE
jgi:hypothetical protein